MSVVESFVREFGLSGVRVLGMVYRYVEERGGGRCFTYRGLMGWWSRKGLYRSIDWHTVERAVRRLAEVGVLKRVFKGRRKVMFCLTDESDAIYQELRGG